MAFTDELPSRYDECMRLSRNLFGARRFGAAYYVLGAALQCAFELADDGRLAAMAEEVCRQDDWITHNLPHHAPSAVSTAQRWNAQPLGADAMTMH
ncbi:MAG TPA: hypothetical protein VGP82_10280 [Ktedonobacterales bacterium]|jgi:hypothetical protein|nr:hypothetical protein [Ktedonobacterales bacterium]